ncbi:peptidyl-tRNA hydrolase [Bacillus oleivorans]|uniref:Peptidyl-tRNA hydrolase n=1 Tax=Bacillus oleivorans TaxID=1448271 RepID=A0A285D956_9BACI|nr:aminoacyl-tRNA hydrolase [Bacillus oleivorans]SNX75703.1 peptidyl-tRNA hydrolase [Bacillus oleivorans]
MKLIVGLGNPGSQYDKTRHNIGFEVIDQLSEQLQTPLTIQKHKGILGKGSYNGESFILLKPLTYMNLSGESIGEVSHFYKIEPSDIVVLYDDLDLPVGKIRLRQKGSAGGHNGLKSTIQHLGTTEFNRIRIGINRPAAGIPVPQYVLGKFTKDEQEMMAEAVKTSANACEAWLTKPFLQVMNEYN